MVDLITYVDRMPHEGETVEAPRFEMGFGGKGANQAVAAALLGADVCLVAKIGDDIFGPDTKRNLERYGIDTTHVEIVPGVSSGVAPIFVDRDSHNSILIIKGANAHLAPQDVDKAKDVIRKSDVVIVQIEIRLESVYRTIEICRSVGVPVILNPAPADPALEVARIKDVTPVRPERTGASMPLPACRQGPWRRSRKQAARSSGWDSRRSSSPSATKDASCSPQTPKGSSPPAE